MNNFIKLENGEFLYNDFGKYRPGICWILKEMPKKVFVKGWEGHSQGKDENGYWYWNNGEKHYVSLDMVEFKEVENIDYLNWQKVHANEFNIEGREMKGIRGTFWKSKKGTNCFRPEKEGKHILVEESWGRGGDRGDISHEEGFLFFSRASSHGGGIGNTFAVIPVGWKKIIKIDEI